MKFRIAFCITELEIGGAEKSLTELICRIDRELFDPSLFVLSTPPSQPTLLEKLESHGVPVHFLGLRGWSQLLAVIVRFACVLRNTQPHLIQSFLFHANLVSRVAARLAGVPVVVSGLRVAERAAQWHVLLDCLTSGYVDQFVCVSHGVAEFAVRQGLPPEKILVIPNGIDRSRFCDERDLSQSKEPLLSCETQQGPGAASVENCDLKTRETATRREYRLLTVARLDYQKGLDWLLVGLANWIHAFENLHLLIVGEGPMKTLLQTLISERGLSGYVTLAGFQKDLAHVFRSADLFVLPSRWEGMPNALLEAMAAGLPVVATDVEGVREVLGNHLDHQLIPVGDACALKRAILWHYFNRQESRNLGLRNRDHVMAHYSWSNVVKRYEELWIRLINRI